MYVSKTGSRAQDALLEGYLPTCHEGLANLFKIKDLTIESCKEFIPKAIEEANDKIACENKVLERFKALHKKVLEAEKEFNENYLNRSKLYKFFIRKYFSVDRFLHDECADRAFYTSRLDTHPYIVRFELGETKINDQRGEVEVDILIVKTDKEGKEFKIIFYTVHKKAKSAQIHYTLYDEYTETLIPTHIAEEIKKAQQIGLTKIIIAKPVIVDTPVAIKDPYVIGWIEQTMFIITRFGLNAEEDKQLAACSSDKCENA